MPEDNVARCLNEVIAALQVLATTTVSDDAATIDERAEAVRAAGLAFDEAVAAVSVEYSPVFEWPDYDPDWDDDEEADGEADPVIRLSVDIREDFVVLDASAFIAAARQMLSERGARSFEEASPVAALDALVATFGLRELTSGPAIDGLQNVGGEWGVSDADADFEAED